MDADVTATNSEGSPTGEFPDGSEVREAGDVAGGEAPELSDEKLLEEIRERAYRISLGSDSDTQEENWFRAKHEILAERAAQAVARQEELDAARDAESRARLSAEIHVYGHP